MKKLFLMLMLLTSPAFAQEAPKPVEKHIYRPFLYETPCMIERGMSTYPDVCVVIETRENGGALRTRNIFSNKHGLTIKGRFDKEKGYMTWDSYNKFEYKWEYKIGGQGDEGAWTYVMPGFLVQNVSWD
jgi:hypothetical protein